jgi:ribosome-interacting GTPase 1
LPTNLPPEAKAKRAQAQQTKDPATKLRLLREFYSSFPKHKSTEKLEMSIKRQMIKLQEEVERSKTRKTGSSRLEWMIRKEGMMQLAIVGSIQSTLGLFNALTRQDLQDYEMLFRPIAGVFTGAYTSFQIIPAPFDDMLSTEKKELFLNLARNVDALLVILRPEDTDYLPKLMDWFESHNIEIRTTTLKAEVIQTPTGGVRIVGSSEKIDEREVLEFLAGYKIRNAVVKLSKGATLDDVESAIYERVAKKAIYVVASEKVIPFGHAKDDYIVLGWENNFDALAIIILKKLGKVRIFTKGIGEEPVMKALVMNSPAKVIDIAYEIHKDLASYFRYARIWREGLVSGMRVGKSFRLQDADVVEIHSV